MTRLMIGILIAGFLSIFGYAASADVTAQAQAGSASQSASGALSVSGGGTAVGGAGGTGVANLSVGGSPVTISSQGSDLGKSIPTAIAPALTTTLSETCLGSATGSMALSGFGGTFGKTYRDDDCIARLHARELRSMGMQDMAMEVLCARPMIYTAMARVAKRKRTLSVCSGMNPGATDYDPMRLSAELQAVGPIETADDYQWSYPPRDESDNVVLEKEEEIEYSVFD